MIIPLPASAQSTWSAGTGSWNSAGNWSPASVPVSGSTNSLIFGGTANYTSTNNLGTFALNQLRFTNTAGTATVTGTSTNALDIVNSSRAVFPTVALTGTGNATLSAPILWDASTAVTNSGSGTLTFSGLQTFANGTKQTFANNGTGIIAFADGVTNYANSGTGNGVVLNFINNNNVANTFLMGNMGNLTNTTFNIGGTGTVKFSGSTSSGLFSSTAVLNVQSGATFDFNLNPESFGAISGAGTIITTVGVSPSLAGYYVFSGKLTGAAGNFTVAGTSHTLVLSGATSDYTGATTITAGRLIVSANVPSGAAGALGNTTSDVLVGNTSGSSLATLVSDTAGVNIGRNVRVQSGNTGLMTVGGINTSGTVTYSGNLILGTDAGVAKGVTLLSATGGTTEFTAGILRATSATGVTDSVTVAGTGTVAMRGTNTFTGTTTVSGGTLLLDDTTSNTQKLSTTAALIMNGGSLTLNGSSAAASTQVVSALTLGNSSGVLGGGGRINVTAGSGQTASVSLGLITRNVGTTIDFNPTNSGASITTSTVNNTSVSTGTDAMNIIGAYATYKLNDWAVNDGSGNIAALAAGSYGTTLGTGLHTSFSAATNAVTGTGVTAVTTNTLRLTGTSAVTFNATGDTFTIESGGILVASTAGTTSIGTTSKRGVLGTSTGELIVQQNSTSTITINSNISGTNLTKSGSGTLVLTGTNTYTGNTIVNGGTLSVTASANLGAATTGLTLNGATLLVPSGTIGSVVSTGHVITVGPAGAVFNFAVGVSFSGNGFAGTGNVTKMGAGAWSVGSNSSSFSGNILLAEGSLTLSSNQLKSVSGITVADGATYGVNDDGVGTFNIASGARFLINGNGLGGNGAIRLTDQSQNVAGAGSGTDPVTTLSNEIVLQTNSRIQVENGSASGSLSLLTISGNISGAGSLDKTGNGVLSITSRDNSYAGNTWVENGTLRTDLGNDRLPTGTSVTLGTGTTSGVLQLSGYSQTIAGLTTAGTGTANAVISGSATSTSLLDVNLASGSQTYAGTLGNATGTANTHANNNLGLIKDGVGSLTLSGANAYSGSTSINAGTVVLGNTSALGGGAGVALATSNGGTTVNSGATLDLNGQSGVQEVITLNGNGVSGAGALVNNGGTAASIGSGVASLTFSAVTTTGWSSASTAVSIGAPGSGTAATGTAQLGLGAASLTLNTGGSGFTSSSGVVTISGGGGSGAIVLPSLGVTATTFVVTSGTTTYNSAPTVTISAGNGVTATGTANLDGTGKVVGITISNAGSGYTGSPTLTFSGGSVNVAGTAPTAAGNSNNFTVVGLTVVNGGTGYTSVPTVTITGGTGATATANDSFVLNGVSLSSDSSGYTSAPTVSLSGGSATATANLSSVVLASDSSVGGSGDLTVDAVVSGSGALTKVGAGTTTLSAANTYTGTTTVSAGTLQVGAGGNGQSGAGALSVNGSGSVLAGSGNIQGSTTVIQGSIKPGDSGGSATGTLNTHDLIFVPVASTTVAELQITGSAGTGLSSDLINVTGALTLSSNGTILVNGSGYTATVGDTFTLLDWSGVLTLNGFSTGTNLRTGANADGNEGNLDLPDITGIGAWQISTLLDAGALTLTVVAVPEPTKGVLVLCGGMLLMMRRRRRCVQSAGLRSAHEKTVNF